MTSVASIVHGGFTGFSDSDEEENASTNYFKTRINFHAWNKQIAGKSRNFSFRNWFLDTLSGPLHDYRYKGLAEHRNWIIVFIQTLVLDTLVLMILVKIATFLFNTQKFEIIPALIHTLSSFLIFNLFIKIQNQTLFVEILYLFSSLYRNKISKNI